MTLPRVSREDRKSDSVNNLKQLGLAMANYGAADQAPSTPDASSTKTNAQSKSTAIERKIVYNAQIELVVESITTLTTQLKTLVDASGGYIAETDVTSYTDSRRNAMWRVRVPVGRFDGFLDALAQLGELQKQHLDSQDVTQEYHDLEAQIENKQKEEKRLQKHLADSTGKLEDILAVEKELSRVRGEIESMQGRIRYLGNQAALSTVTITATELHDYEPPVTATFAALVRRTFFDSVGGVLTFGKGLVLVFVTLVPWIPIIAILCLFGVWLKRRVKWSRRPAAG